MSNTINNASINRLVNQDASPRTSPSSPSQDIASTSHAAQSGSGDSASRSRPEQRRQGNQVTLERLCRNLTLADLRINDEQDHDLVTVPSMQNRRSRPAQAQVDGDPAVAALSGRAYLEHLSTNDLRIPSELRTLIKMPENLALA
ncbi:MAG: hypothetical protein GZ090_10190 [Oxalobacteraceae bacterium]|nr:hypothetical protein [Oxalobacteraceae bacterium]